METYHGHEQPIYEVVPLVKQRETYELRHYVKSNWTSTKVECRKYDEGTGTAFRKLFEYIQGNNSRRQQVDMTVPVVSKIENVANKNTFTGVQMVMSFFLPKSHQIHPPEPVDESVFTEKKSDFYVYVRRFGGYAESEDWMKNAEALRAELQRDGLYISNKPFFYAVSYDSPFRLRDRRNEVWIKAAGDS